MAWLSLSGFDCTRGRVTMPRIGPWVADLVLNPTTSPGNPPAANQPVQLSLNGALRLNGTVRRTQNAYGTIFTRVIGGAAGFPTTVPAVAYGATAASAVLNDLLSAIGEQPSGQSDGQLLATSLPGWVRPGAAMAALAMTALVNELGASWRILPDGTTWVGQESWPASTMKFTLLSYSPQELKMVVASDGPTVLPGQSIGGAYVSVVEHIVEEHSIRSEILFEDPQLLAIAGLGSDRLKLDLQNFIRAVQPSFDFYAWHPGTVAAPGLNPNTFDFTPDNPNLPGLSGLTGRTGVPGETIQVDPTSSPRCLLGFEGGDPKAPCLGLWSAGSLLTYELDAEVSINLSAPIVGLGQSWMPLLTALSTAANSGGPLVAVNAAATTLLGLIQSLQAT